MTEVYTAIEARVMKLREPVIAPLAPALAFQIYERTPELTYTSRPAGPPLAYP